MTCKCGVEIDKGNRCKRCQAEYMREYRKSKRESVTPEAEECNTEEAAPQAPRPQNDLDRILASVHRLETRLDLAIRNADIHFKYFCEVVEENRAKVAARHVAREVASPNGGAPITIGDCYECGEADCPRRPSRNGMAPRCYCDDCYGLIMSGENQAPRL